MPKVSKSVVVLSPEEKLRRKRYLSATLVTCISLVMILGSLHVVRLGSMRMGEMRALATYDLREESSRIRAAGEDIVLHEQNEAHKKQEVGYTVAEAEALLTKDQWQKLDSMVKVPAGNFLMGSDLKNADASSHPQHTTNIW
jgi:iron(II)-dependent oxidoreductase